MHKATSTSGYSPAAAAIASISARFADTPCIFQLPATSFFNAISSPCSPALARGSRQRKPSALMPASPAPKAARQRLPTKLDLHALLLPPTFQLQDRHRHH